MCPHWAPASGEQKGGSLKLTAAGGAQRHAHREWGAEGQTEKQRRDVTSRESLESKRKGHLRGEVTRGPCPRTDGIASPLPGEPNKLQAAGAAV